MFFKQFSSWGPLKCPHLGQGFRILPSFWGLPGHTHTHTHPSAVALGITVIVAPVTLHHTELKYKNRRYVLRNINNPHFQHSALSDANYRLATEHKAQI